MKKYIDENELNELLDSYDLKGLIFDYYKSVEPDTDIYIFHDGGDKQYCLIASDYLDEAELPCEFIFDYFKDANVSFEAVKRFSYKSGASKVAEGYVDDDHFRTMASTGDVCMMYEIEDLSGQMNEKEILESIKENLVYLSKERPREFYYSVDAYADDYEKDSLCSLICDWQKLTSNKFSESFPITWGIVLTVRALWDGVERERLLYEDLIDHSKLAIKEISDYLDRL